MNERGLHVCGKQARHRRASGRLASEQVGRQAGGRVSGWQAGRRVSARTDAHIGRNHHERARSCSVDQFSAASYQACPDRWPHPDRFTMLFFNRPLMGMRFTLAILTHPQMGAAWGLVMARILPSVASLF